MNILSKTNVIGRRSAQSTSGTILLKNTPSLSVVRQRI
jgi:hypothetical protein